MRDFYLTEVIIYNWRIIDPYFNNEEQRDLFGLCMNTIVKYRAKIGLPERKKGRPNTVLTFADTKKEYPPEVIKALKDIKAEVKRMLEAYKKYKEEKQKGIQQINEEVNTNYKNIKNKYRTNNINKENK